MNNDLNKLLNRNCRRYSEDEIPLSMTKVEQLMLLIPMWSHNAKPDSISRTLKFNNYYQTISFVNSLAWIAHQQDHHPDLKVSYSSCEVSFTTHSIDGLTENDFISAARIDHLIK